MTARNSFLYVLFSQLALGFFLLVCTVLDPHYLLSRNEGGTSNFGTNRLTVVPYSLALWLCGIFLLLAAHNLTKHAGSRVNLKPILSLLGVLYILVVLSTYPYKLNLFYTRIHIAISIILFVSQLVIGIRFAILQSDWLNRSTLGLLFGGVMLSTMTLMGFLPILFISQIITAVAFAILLVRTVFFIMNQRKGESLKNNRNKLA